MWGGLKSITFSKTPENRYMVTFDPNVVKYIKLSHGFCCALGYLTTNTISNGSIASDPPSAESPYSHICIFMNSILRSLHKNNDAEIAVIPVEKEKKIYQFFSHPLYFKVEKTFVDSVSLYFEDFFGNSLVCDNANGHFVLQFVKERK